LRGAPVFCHGLGSSDVLHVLLVHRETPFRLLVGHSKGALKVGNAIESLPPERPRALRVVTLGCPSGKNLPGVDYHQYLGLFDALGQLGAWGIGSIIGRRPGTAPIRFCRWPRQPASSFPSL
jgi:hypothetical protein